MGFTDTVKEAVKETASAAYSNAMRLVSTEASVSARRGDACFKDFQLKVTASTAMPNPLAIGGLMAPAAPQAAAGPLSKTRVSGNGAPGMVAAAILWCSRM